MQQRGGVQQLHGGGNLHPARAGVAAEFGGQHEQRRAQALAPGFQHMLANVAQHAEALAAEPRAARRAELFAHGGFDLRQAGADAPQCLGQRLRHGLCACVRAACAPGHFRTCQPAGRRSPPSLRPGW